MPGASLALFADLGACHVQKSSVTICVLPTPFRWRETKVDYIVQHRIGISIHALRVEGDIHGILLFEQTADFYPRPPGGGRHVTLLTNSTLSIFLSTPSGWRATSLHRRCRTKAPNFYPRPPGGGRLTELFGPCGIGWISIHALRVEGDVFFRFVNFLLCISIHALREEGDSAVVHRDNDFQHVETRPPGGGRHISASGAAGCA